MRESDLPSPGIGPRGYHLRRIMTNSISQLQIASRGYAGNLHPAAADLSAFIAAAKAVVDAMLPTAPTLTFTPTAKSYSIAAGAAQAGPILGGAPGATVTYSSSDPTKATVNVQTGAVTPLATGTTTITATVAKAGAYLATTKTYVATVTA